MKTILKVIATFGVAAGLAAPLHGQFTTFNPTSAGTFNASGLSGAVTGSIEWDNLVWAESIGDPEFLRLRVSLTNVSTDNDVLTGFGFQTPIGLAETPVVQLHSVEGGDFGIGQNLSQPLFNVGVSVGVQADNPMPHKGIQPGTQGIFNFLFPVGDVINTGNFSYEGFGFATADPAMAFRTQAGDAGISERFDSSVTFFTPGEDGNGFTPVPEPSTYGLAGIALLGLLIFGRRMRQNKKA